MDAETTVAVVGSACLPNRLGLCSSFDDDAETTVIVAGYWSKQDVSVVDAGLIFDGTPLSIAWYELCLADAICAQLARLL